jgi:hypothetical protein
MLTCLLQTRSAQVSRAAFSGSRFMSAKAPTLKERLAELIPKELENVRHSLCVCMSSVPYTSRVTGQGRPC